MRLILDAHADLAWIALAYNRHLTETIAQINQRESEMKRVKGWGDATSCLPEMRRGAIALCQGTLFARTNRTANSTSREYLRTDYDFGTQSMAYAIAQGQLAYYRQFESEGEMTIIQTPHELDQQWQRCLNTESEAWPIGIILAIEGADPIVCPKQVEKWFGDGLRSVMLSHYGKSNYAVGRALTAPTVPSTL